MSEDYDKLIELAPSAPIVQQDTTSQWMDWEAVALQTFSLRDIKPLESVLSRGAITVTLLVSESSTVKLRVRQSPIGNYTELYLASLRAIFHLEKQIGRVHLLERIPRDKWDVNFITARQFGPFE